MKEALEAAEEEEVEEGALIRVLKEKTKKMTSRFRKKEFTKSHTMLKRSLITNRVKKDMTTKRREKNLLFNRKRKLRSLLKRRSKLKFRSSLLLELLLKRKPIGAILSFENSEYLKNSLYCHFCPKNEAVGV